MFKQKSKIFAKNINSWFYEFIHTSGLRVIVILPPKERQDEFYFELQFYTPPQERSGLAHITEHVVLHGSKKYKSDDLFFQLYREAPLSLLNASTYLFYTNYYFSAPTYKLFSQVKDIYLDSVFNPLLDKNKIIREGVEVLQKAAPSQKDIQQLDQYISGVVFNEMLAAFASTNLLDIAADRIPFKIFKQLKNKRLPYGEPPDMVFITPEDIQAFHAKYYHPSNGVLYLYGNFDLDNMLKDLENGLNETLGNQKATPQEQWDYLKTVDKENKIHELKINAVSEKAKDILLFLSQLPDDKNLARKISTIYSKAFSHSCGPINKYIKTDPKLQSFDTFRMLYAPIDLFLLYFQNIPREDIQDVANKISEIIPDTIKQLPITKINKQLQRQHETLSIFNTTPFVRKLIETLRNYYPQPDISLEDVVRMIDTPIQLTKADLDNAAELFASNLFTFDIQPDTKFMVKIHEEIIKNLQKTQPRIAAPLKPEESELLIQPKLNLVNRSKFQQDWENLTQNQYFVKTKIKNLNLLYNLTPLQPDNMDENTFYFFPLFNHLFDNDQVFPYSFRRNRCFSAPYYLVSLGLHLKAGQSGQNFAFLHNKIYSYKNHERTAINTFQKELSLFDISSINKRKAKSLIQSYLKDLDYLGPDELLRLYLRYLVKDIDSAGWYHYITGDKMILDYLETPERFENIDDILRNAIQIKEALISLQPTWQFLGAARFNNGVKFLASKIKEIFAKNSTVSKDLTPFNASRIKTASLQTKYIQKSLNLPAGYLISVNILKKSITAQKDPKEFAHIALAISYLNHYVAIPFGRGKYQAYGAYIGFEPKTTNYWYLLLHSAPRKLLEDPEKIRQEFIDVALNSTPLKVQIDQLKLQLLNGITRPKGDFAKFNQAVDYIIGLKNEETTRKIIQVVRQANIKDVKRAIEKLFAIKEERYVVLR